MEQKERQADMTQGMQYASMIVRLWRLAGKSENAMPVRWQGEVEQIQSGQTWKFSSFEQLVEFLKKQVDTASELAWIEMPEMEPNPFQKD